MDCLIISGLSGAGKSVTVDVLEDIGYYCIDNMPVKLIPQFAELFGSSAEKNKKVAFVVDIRGGRDHSYLFRALEDMERAGSRCRILFLDCSDEVLINRQKASRRRHPLDVDGLGLAAAVAQERELMEPMRRRAAFVIDTTALSAAGLKSHLHRLFGEEGSAAMVITVCSFGYKYGIPHEADLVFDVRFLKNPYYVPELKEQTGLSDAVYDYVFSDPNAEVFIGKLRDLLAFALPLYLAEGKTSLVIAVGCTGGRHRSVSVSRRLCKELRGLGQNVTLRHRDAEKG